jgi:hypothetical protein
MFLALRITSRNSSWGKPRSPHQFDEIPLLSTVVSNLRYLAKDGHRTTLAENALNARARVERGFPNTVSIAAATHACAAASIDCSRPATLYVRLRVPLESASTR